MSRACSQVDGTFSGSSISCSICVPPAAFGAAAVYQSSWNWLWSCKKGFFGDSITRTCNKDSANVFGGTAISCATCDAPTENNTDFVSVGGASADTWRYRCVAGSYGATTLRLCDTISGAFAGDIPTCAVCNDASGGHYCVGGDNVGGVNSLGKYKCPAGVFGAPDTSLTSPTCSGACTAGYYCPEASFSSTQVPCGEVYQYCPAGSGAPLTVQLGWYTTPLDAPPMLRTGQAICPTDRQCAGGLLLPPVTFGATCPNGEVIVNVMHGSTRTLFGAAVVATTPGYTGLFDYVLASLEANPGCNDGTEISLAVSYNTVANRLYTTVDYAASFITCPTGFTVTLMSRRIPDITLTANCTIRVRVQEVALPPVFSFCGNVTVLERQGAGASVDRALTVTVPNKNSAVFFNISATSEQTAPDLPFFLGLCDGLFRASRDLAWKDRASFSVQVVARNDGSATGLGIAESTCNMWINVLQLARPPVPRVTIFTAVERVAVGTFVGNVGAVDPEDFPITAYSLTRTGATSGGASMNAFAVDGQGNLTFRELTTIPSPLPRVTLFYTLNVSNAYAMGSYPLSVTLSLAPVPPKAFDDVRSVLEGSFTVATPILPPLNGTASRPGLTLTYSVFPTTLFDVYNETGVLFVKPGVVLAFAQQQQYTLAVTLTDSEGQLGIGSVVVNVREANRPPVWQSQSGASNGTGVWTFSAAEGEGGGAPVGKLTATDPNLRGDAITYRILGSVPMVRLPDGLRVFPLVIDGASGALSVVPIPGGLVLDRELQYLRPFTFAVNVSAVDNGVPPRDVNGTVWFTLRDVAPRWNQSSYSVVGVSAGALAGVQVLACAPRVWAPYNSSSLVFAMIVEATAGGAVGFTINSVTGVITTLDGGSGSVFDPNTRPVFRANLTVADSSTSRSASTTLTIALQAVNRPPMLPPQVFTAPSLMSGNVGETLVKFVEDPDLALSVGERFAFTLVGGNNDTTFGINAATGQIFVLNNGTNAFQFVPGKAFYLIVNVTDAGINGPRLWSTSVITVVLLVNSIRPTVPYVNLTVAEHAAVGTVLGRVRAMSLNTGSELTYALAAAEVNINQPFPFAIRTVASGTAGGPAEGELYVLGDQGPIHFSPWRGQGLFSAYAGVVTVSEIRAGLTEPLTSQGDLDVYVRWVAEPPFFDPTVTPPAPASKLNAYIFRLALDEHSPAGTLATGAVPILAFTKDPWQTAALRYSLVGSGVPMSYFSVHAVTGNLTLAPGVPDLQFNAMPSYTVTVSVRDAGALSDTAAVVVSISDVNDVAVFDGVYDAANVTRLAENTAIVSQDAPMSTVFGVVRFVDPDRRLAWGSKRYSLVGDAKARFFGVQPDGTLFVAAPGADWNDQSSFRVTVLCTDADPLSPLTGNFTITIALNQTNRVRVNGFSVAPSAPMGSGVAVPGSAYAASHGGSHDVLFASTGSVVLLNGTGFGYSAARIVRDGLQLSSTTVTARYGPTGTEYTAADCAVTLAGLQVTCTVAIGIGRDHLWTLTVAAGRAWSATSTRRTGYMPPLLSAVTRTGGTPSDATTQTMRTDAVGESITLDGANLGPFNTGGSRTPVRLSYGQLDSMGGFVVPYTTALCLMVMEHAQVRCDALPGIGANLVFVVTVGGQASAPFSASSVRYATPEVTGVVGPVLTTRGGQAFNVSGTSFGPPGTTRIVVRYCADFLDASLPVFISSQCMVPPGVGHTRLTCVSAPGIGAGLRVRVEVAGQESASSGPSAGTTLAYELPQVTYISGVGADGAATIGGQQVVIDGTGFGPLSDLAPDGSPVGPFGYPVAYYGRQPLSYPTTPFRYAGVECRVIVAHTQMLCLTAPGTGMDHVWAVVIGAQSSAIFSARRTSYAPPTVASYTGAGSKDGLTSGAQPVVIMGYNMGPLGTAVEKVTYGRSVAGDEFVASNCTLTRAHEEVTCYTVAGAGAGLSWFVSIGGQRSVAPATAYGQPIIDDFSGSGASDASTDGGQDVVITGRFLSLQTFLESVTYGPSGREYTAASCTITVPHTQVTCRTVPGTGRLLRWRVTVGGQTSDLSASSTSYAPPRLLGVAPATGPTAGGVRVVLTGRDLGLAMPSSRLDIRVNAVGVTTPPRPSQQDLDGHIASVYAGGAGDATVARWIAGMSAPPAIFPSFTLQGNHSVSFLLPEGFGAGRELLVLVDGVPSNMLAFSYVAPVVTNVAPDRLGVPVGSLRLIVEGENFCSGLNGCGRLVVDGVEVQARNYSHGRIVAVVPDPLAAGAASSTVLVLVGGGAGAPSTLSSNAVTFSTPVPAFDAISGQGSWGGGSVTVVQSASVELVLSLRGPADAVALLQPTTAGPLRSAIGRGAGVPTSLVVLTGVTDLATGAITLVRRTDGANTVPAARRVQGTAGSGVNISVSIDVAGAVSAAGGVLTPAAVTTLTSSMVAALKSGVWLSGVAQALDTALSQVAGTFSATVDPAAVSSAVTTTATAAGGAMNTRGGQPFYIKAVSSIANVPAADIRILIAGRPCTGMTKTQDGDLGPAYGVPASSPLAAQYITFELACLTPPGVGKDMPILIAVPGGTSQDDPNFRFSYSAPNVSAVVDNADLRLSYTQREVGASAATSGAQVNGVPTLGLVVRLQGSNFGEPSLLVSSDGVVIPSSWALSLRLLDALSGSVTSVTPVSHDHESIVFRVPPGYGKDIRVEITVGGQADVDPVAGGPGRAPTLLRYARPVVTTIFDSGTALQFGATVGGARMSITGSNFGLAGAGARPEDGKPFITIGGVEAPLAFSFLAYSDHSRLDLVLPEGWGKDLPVVVTVAGQSSLGGATYTYAPPAVARVFPSSGPTSGLRPNGEKLNVTLSGSNLGRAGSVQLRPTVLQADSPAVTITVPHSAMTLHNHTHMVFPMPEGAGDHLQVVAVVGGQDSVGTSVFFSYEAPIVASIVNADRGEAECAVRRVPLLLSNASGVPVYVNRSVYPSYPGCYPTAPDMPFTLRVVGESFGAPAFPMRVTIGGKSCEVLWHDHNSVACVAPGGMGDRNPVLVTVGGRSNALTPAAFFAYDPPVIEAIVPNPADAAEGEAISLRGFNMGPLEAPVIVTISGRECREPTWLNDRLLRCITQPDTVGRKNVTVLAANRTTPFVWYEPEGKLEFRCKRGFYGLQGETCVECGMNVDAGQQAGAKCPGSELEVDLVTSLPGWWRFNSTEPVQCHPRRTHRALDSTRSPGCPVFVACEPPESCLGANQCAGEYAGDRCAACAKSYYRVSGECIKCPDSPWAVVIIFCVAALAALFGAYTLNAKSVNLSLISIGMDWAQVVAMFARTRIRWPALVKQIFLILSAFNLNLELIAPECAVPEVTYAGKWLFIEGMPVFSWVFLFLFFVVRLAWKGCVLGRKRSSLFNHLPTLVATGIVAQRVLYLYMTRTTLDIFNCSPTDPPEKDKDGKEILYMAWNLNIVCNEPGGTHMFLLPFAVAALAVYVVGLPCASLWWLWKNKQTVKYDQILRAQLTGDSKRTNPHYTFRKTWKALYMNYRPGSWGWEFVVVLRKFLIVFCSLTFRRTPSYQLAMALLVLFVAYVLQVRVNPYLSHASAANTAVEHARKVLESNELHINIEEDMRARAVYNSRAGGAGDRLENDASAIEGARRSRVVDVQSFLALSRTPFQRAQLQGRAVILRNKTASILFDYNTAEATLLASAVLINLAGICFDSSRFSGASGARKEVVAEYDSLTFAILIVMFASIAFWFMSLAMDLALVLNPNSVSKCLGGATALGDRALSAAKKQASQMGVSTGRRAARRTHGGGAKTIDSADSGAEVHLTNNSALLEQALSQGSRVLDADRISSRSEPPNALEWNEMQSAYRAMQDVLKNTRQEAEQMRLALDLGGVGAPAGVSPLAVSPRVRTEFKPVSVTAGSVGGQNPLLRLHGVHVRVSERRTGGTQSSPRAADDTASSDAPQIPLLKGAAGAGAAPV